jgi:hypothetical protein
VLGEGLVDVLQIGCLAATRRTIIDDLALDLPLLEIDYRHALMHPSFNLLSYHSVSLPQSGNPASI